MENPYGQLCAVMRAEAMRREIAVDGCRHVTIVSGRLIPVKGTTIDIKSEDTGYLYRMAVSASRSNSVIGIIAINGISYYVRLEPYRDGKAAWSLTQGWVA